MTGLFPSLASPRLLLRSFADTDLMHVYQGLSHPDVIPYYGVSFDSPEAAKAQMAFYKNLEETGTGIWWAVCSPDNRQFYGAGGLSSLSKVHRKAEVGFWLLPEYWGKGLLQEAMTLICNYGFTELNLHRIEGFVETENERCKKAIEKAGFALEGTLKECEWKNDRWISLDVYALLVNAVR